MKPAKHHSAFTLIELSIVLVIIGLIVGGVLVGRDLISAAGVRAQISQIEKFQQAVNTFKGKYGYLPGDIPDPDATKFGFIPRGIYAGQGNGNNIIEGTSLQCRALTGEQGMAWTDLSTAKLIEGTFSADFTTELDDAWDSDTLLSFQKNRLPQAKLGQLNFIYVHDDLDTSGVTTNINHFGIARNIIPVDTCHVWSSVGLTVKEASAIDGKIDDGLPQTGNVLSKYIYLPYYGAIFVGNSGTTATAGSSSTCYDNSNVAGGVQRYSLSQNNGNGLNCALSFKFQ